MKTSTDIQIRFADVDMLGHVNNVNLQHYFDLGKNDLFAALLGMREVDGREGLITASTRTDYFAQTRYRDQIAVESTVEKIGNKSFTLVQNIINKATGAVVATSHTVMVTFDFKAQQPIVIPPAIRKALERCLE